MKTVAISNKPAMNESRETGIFDHQPHPVTGGRSCGAVRPHVRNALEKCPAGTQHTLRVAFYRPERR